MIWGCLRARGCLDVQIERVCIHNLLSLPSLPTSSLTHAHPPRLFLPLIFFFLPFFFFSLSQPPSSPFFTLTSQVYRRRRRRRDILSIFSVSCRDALSNASRPESAERVFPPTPIFYADWLRLLVWTSCPVPPALNLPSEYSPLPQFLC